MYISFEEHNGPVSVAIDVNEHHCQYRAEGTLNVVRPKDPDTVTIDRSFINTWRTGFLRDSNCWRLAVDVVVCGV